MRGSIFFSKGLNSGNFYYGWLGETSFRWRLAGGPIMAGLEALWFLGVTSIAKEPYSCLIVQGSGPLSPVPHPIDPRMPRTDENWPVFEPNEPAHEILYLSHLWAQKAQSHYSIRCMDVDKDSRPNFRPLATLNSSAWALKGVFRVCLANDNLPWFTSKHVHCAFYVFQRNVSFSALFCITNNVSTGAIVLPSSSALVNRSLDSSKVKFATILNSTFQLVSVADHVGLSTIWW